MISSASLKVDAQDMKTLNDSTLAGRLESNRRAQMDQVWAIWTTEKIEVSKSSELSFIQTYVTLTSWAFCEKKLKRNVLASRPQMSRRVYYLDSRGTQKWNRWEDLQFMARFGHLKEHQQLVEPEGQMQEVHFGQSR